MYSLRPVRSAVAYDTPPPPPETPTTREPWRLRGTLQGMETSHTIVLVQYNLQDSSRTYLDYEGLPRALDGVFLSLVAAT